MIPKKACLLILAGLLVLTFACRREAQEQAVQKAEPPVLQPAPRELPAKVAEVIQKYFSDAEVASVETEKVDGLMLYDVEFKNNRGEIEVAEDGTIIDITSIITWEELPAAAAEAVKKVLEETAASLERLEKAEVQAEVREQEGKKAIFRLAEPYWLYEAELSRNQERGEVQVDGQGKIIEGPKWQAKVK